MLRLCVLCQNGLEELLALRRGSKPDEPLCIVLTDIFLINRQCNLGEVDVVDRFLNFVPYGSWIPIRQLLALCLHLFVCQLAGVRMYMANVVIRAELSLL